MPITLVLPLDWPDVRVVASRVLEDATLLIEVESTLRMSQCHRCGREIDRFHGFDRPILLRHLPVFERAVLIEIRPAQRRAPPGAGGAHRRVAALAPPGMAVAESRPAGKSGRVVRANPGLGQRRRAAHPADGDLRAQPGSGYRPEPTSTLDRTGHGLRFELF